MTGSMIKGKELSEQIRKQIRSEAEEIAKTTANGRMPGLAVVQVGEDPASSIYVRHKKTACEEVGFCSYEYKLPEECSQEELFDLIDVLNTDPLVDGILCQSPFPAHIDERAVFSRISHDKDPDGFHPMNKGLLSMGVPAPVPCTPLGCMELLRHNGIEIAGKTCVVVGRSDIVGKPMVSLLTAADGTVTLTHSKTKDLPAVCRTADILVVAIGRKHFITADYVKPGAVIIDVGINRGEGKKVHGDVDFEAVKDIVSAISPVPGGVGPMTITMLMKNTLMLYKKSLGLPYSF